MTSEQILRSKERAYEAANYAFDLIAYRDAQIERLEQRIKDLEVQNARLIEEKMDLKHQLLNGGTNDV